MQTGADQEHGVGGEPEDRRGNRTGNQEVVRRRGKTNQLRRVGGKRHNHGGRVETLDKTEVGIHHELVRSKSFEVLDVEMERSTRLTLLHEQERNPKPTSNRRTDVHGPLVILLP